MGRLLRWVTATHTLRHHANHRTTGEGHLYQSRFKSFPVADDDHFLLVCRYVEGNPLRADLVQRAEDWKYSSLSQWIQKPEHPPALLSPWPIPRTPNWVERVNEPLRAKQLAAIRLCVQRGRPFGNDEWVAKEAERTGLGYSLRSPGRPRQDAP